MKLLNFVSNGRNLSGAVFFPSVLKEKNPAILFIHGWTSEKIRSYRYAEELARLGYISFLFDMSGHGESEGDIKLITGKEFLDDCEVAYDTLSALDGIDKNNIFAVGSSFGGYLVALLTRKRALSGVVLRVPADYPDGTENNPKYQTGGDVPEIANWRKKIKKYDESTALRSLNSFAGKVLIIESELDEQVPHETVQSYVNAVSDTKNLTHILMKNAPHSIKEGPFKEEVVKILNGWFENIPTQ